jgi:hypothetical protein
MGYAKHKIENKKYEEAHLGTIFDLGVHEGDTTLIWGVRKGVQF